MNYILARVIRQFIPVVFIASVAIFLLMELLPGDPAQIMLGPFGTNEQVEALREEMGLNRPIHERYLLWLGDAVQGDFGRSVTGKTVRELISSALPATLELALVAFLLGNLLGVMLGVVAGITRGGWPDLLISGVNGLLIAVPSFVAGLLYLLIFVVWLDVFPSAGRVPLLDDPWLALQHLALPALALGGIISAVIARFTRQSIVDTLSNDYIRTARAKGLPERLVIIRHALKPSMIPVVTVSGIQIGGLIGGTIVIERVFTWPGMGRVLVGAVDARDYNTIQAITLLLVISYVFFNLMTDVLYGVLDPRVKVGRGVGA